MTISKSKGEMKHRTETDRRRRPSGDQATSGDAGLDNDQPLSKLAQESSLDLVVALDASGSMALPFREARTEIEDPSTAIDQDQRSKIEWIGDVLAAIVSHLDAANRIGVVAYNNRAATIRPLTRSEGSDLEDIRTSIHQCGVYGGANLCSGLERAASLFEDAEDSRAKHVLFVSDSLPSASPNESPFLNRVREITTGEIVVTFVGLDADPTPECRGALADIEGVTQQYISSVDSTLLV
jgi:Ca-activated chloride channel family protein